MEKTEWMVYMRSVKKDYDAVGRFDGKGVIVLKGSRICADWKINSNRLLEQRRHYVNNKRVLMKDLCFASPSQASKFVCGRSSNGWVMWRFENGDVLDSFREKRETDIQEKKNESWQAFVTDTKPEIAAVDQVHNRNEMYSPERNEGESIEKNDADTRKHAQHNALNIERIASEKPSEDDWIAELFRQVAQLQEVVLQQKKTCTIAEQSAGDNRYRIAAHRADSPEVFVYDYEKPIQNLTFSRDFFSKDDEKKASRFQAFFMDDQYGVVSNIVEFNMESGQTIHCRFTLKSKMSGKKVCFLGIRDSRDLHDELLKLIPFRIEILFNADFDL